MTIIMVESTNAESALRNDGTGDDANFSPNIPTTPSASPPVQDEPDESIKNSLPTEENTTTEVTTTTVRTIAGDNAMTITTVAEITTESCSVEFPEKLVDSNEKNALILPSVEVALPIGQPPVIVPPSPSRTAVEALYKKLPRFYKGHNEHRTQWDHPLLTKIFEEDIASFNDVRYAAYRTALKFRTISVRLQMHQIKLSTIRNVLRQHGYEAVYQNQTLLPCVELETLMADIYLSARREVPNIESPELNAELLLSLLLKLYDTNRFGCIKLISAKIGLALLASASYLEKWKYILSELFDYNRCLSRKNAFNLLHDVARIPEILGEKKLFGTHLVQAAVESLWIRGRPTQIGLPEEAFRHWLKDEPQTLVWLSTSYRIRQAERLRHFVKCSICKAYPINGLRYRCLRCYNYNMCQTCFFTGKLSKSHRLRHPIREYCSLVSAGQETKDLIKIMKNRVFHGEDYVQKPRYMPILPDSVSALEMNADMDADIDTRSRSTAPSHNSTGTPSGSVNAVNKKDFEVDVEIISELGSTQGGLDRSNSNIVHLGNGQSNAPNINSHIPRSISEPVDSINRFTTTKETNHDEEIEMVKPKELTKAKIQTEISAYDENHRVSTQRQISAVTAQIMSYAEVDVVLPKLPPAEVEVYLPKLKSFPPGDNRVKYTQVQVSNAPVEKVKNGNVGDAGNQTDPSEFSGLDYIDASPRGEPNHDTKNRGLYPRVINKSSIEIQTDATDRNGYETIGEESRRKFAALNKRNRQYDDQYDGVNRLLDSSSPSPELVTNTRIRNVAFENQLEQLEKMLVDNLGPKSAPVHHGWTKDKASPVWKIDPSSRAFINRQPANNPPLPPSRRSESVNDSLHGRADIRVPPFPVNNVPKAASDPNTPLRKPLPVLPLRHQADVSDGLNGHSSGSSNGSPVAYHPILDELEEKLKSLNTPLTQRDLKHPFWHHLKEKFEYVLGQSGRAGAVSHTYQSYGRIDKDYAHTPAGYGRNIAHNSNLDVSDSLLPGITQPSPNESQSSGFSSGRETDLKWEEESYNGLPAARLSVSTNYRAIPRSKSLGISSHRQVNQDIAQLDKLLEWLDEFKKSS